MGIGARVFFVEDDNRLRHISFKRWEDLVRNGKEAKPFPEYAGQKVRCALIVLQVENRKPIKITGLECTYFLFDDEGRLDQEQRQRNAQRAVDTLEATLTAEIQNESVIDARLRFLNKQTAAQRWEPTQEIVLAIKKATFIEKSPIPKPPTPSLRLID